MIEAVNSVLSNAQALRGISEAVDVARSQAVTPATTREIAVPKAPYISPFLSVDVNFDTTVLQIRDSDTGDVINQYPSESRLRQIRTEEAARQKAAELSQPQTQSSAPQQQSSTGQSSSAGIGFAAQDQQVSQPSVPQAQIASAALAAAAQTSINSLSAGVSVAA